jgi:hypothetical protein
LTQLVQPESSPLYGIQYGSRLFADVMSRLFLGQSNTSILSHWMGLAPLHPRTPLYTQALAAALVSKTQHRSSAD